MRLIRQGMRMRRTSAGFTLVELMTVVAIMGILAAVAVHLVKTRVTAAKSTRGLIDLRAIRVAEEQFKAQNGQYLGCSSTSAPKWYPAETPGTVEYDWRQSGHPDWNCWRLLNIPRANRTQYGFMVNAGRPGDAFPPLLTTNDPPLPSTATDLWYVIQVRGNVDEDSTYMQAVSTSYEDRTYIENELE